MAVTVRTVTSTAAVDAAIDLAEQTWGARPIAEPMLRALQFAGSYVSVATDGDADADADADADIEAAVEPTDPAEILGMCAGFVGVHDAADGHHLHLHSHLAAVRADVQGRGIGRALKWHQRDWCLVRDIDTVTWTFDPLVRTNARFNLHHLGAVGDRYLVDLYGAMDDDINRGQPSDRILIRWDLRSGPVLAARHGPLPVADRAAFLAAGAAAVIATDAGQPTARSSDAPVRLVDLPADIAALRRADPDAALAWRLAVRAAMVDAFAAGLTPVALTEDFAYVCAQEAP